jgi:regulator of protease activity HflC (stomatin/prohibitin superfamily)
MNAAGEVNLAEGEKQAAILTSEGAKTAAINKAQGEASAITTIEEATAGAVRNVAAAINAEGGLQAANLKVAELYIAAFGNLAKAGNTLIVPSNMADMATLVSAAMTMLDRARPAIKGAPPSPAAQS